MPPCMAAVMVNAGRRGHEDRSKQHKTKLRESLLNNAKKLFTKFREWDIDGDGMVDKEEFRNAIPKMGIPMMAKIDPSDIDDLFDTLDIDGSGAISIDDFYRFCQFFALLSYLEDQASVEPVAEGEVGELEQLEAEQLRQVLQMSLDHAAKEEEERKDRKSVV